MITYLYKWSWELRNFYEKVEIFSGDLIGFGSIEIKYTQLVANFHERSQEFFRELNWLWFNWGQVYSTRYPNFMKEIENFSGNLIGHGSTKVEYTQFVTRPH